MGQVQKVPRDSGSVKDIQPGAGRKVRETEGNGSKRPRGQVEELRLRYEKAQEENRAKTDFINTLSHELRMPIHVIVGYGDLLVDSAWGTLQESQKTIVVKIKQNACYLLDLITDLMELNRLDGGRSLAQCEEIDVNELLEEMKTMAQFMPKTEGVILEVMRPTGLPPLFSDRDKLKIILRNLLGNASKFTQRGKITIRARFDPGMQAMQLCVRDTGIGIDEKDQRRIFDMFWQEDTSHARPFRGVGLGLYIVRRLADQLGAKIEVESRKGKGSLFRLIIPIRPV